MKHCVIIAIEQLLGVSQMLYVKEKSDIYRGLTLSQIPALAL
jgi:hypothetical protein